MKILGLANTSMNTVQDTLSKGSGIVGILDKTTGKELIPYDLVLAPDLPLLEAYLPFFKPDAAVLVWASVTDLMVADIPCGDIDTSDPAHWICKTMWGSTLFDQIAQATHIEPMFNRSLSEYLMSSTDDTLTNHLLRITRTFKSSAYKPLVINTYVNWLVDSKSVKNLEAELLLFGVDEQVLAATLKWLDSKKGKQAIGIFREALATRTGYDELCKGTDVTPYDLTYLIKHLETTL